MKNKIISKLKELQGLALLKVLLIITIVILLITVSVIVFFYTGKKDKKEAVVEDEVKSVKIAPNMLWLPEEPLELPPIQFSREQKKIWSEEDVKEFYQTPSEETMQKLNDVNTEKIKKLLEAVE